MSAFKSACATGVAVIAALTVVSCSSSGGDGQTSSAAGASAPTTPAPTSNAAPSSEAPASTPEAGSLTGKWSGEYHGAFEGTFTLHWTQTGSQLSGSIDLSTAGMVPVHGTVTGGQINFGTVGSTVITYSGSVSGDSMSGHYQIAGGTGGTGSWSASRS